MNYYLMIVRDSSGEIDVYISNISNLVEEKKEHLENGEYILAAYPLEGSLQALGILVSDSLQFGNSFGSQVEELLTKMVRDIYVLKEEEK
jgi:hypothetical protein